MKWFTSAEDREADRLLAQNRVSGPEREEILAGVLGQVQQPARVSSLFRWGTTALALAALILVPVFVLRGKGDNFRSRGAQSAALVEVACAGPCSVGTTLLFRTEALSE